MVNPEIVRGLLTAVLVIGVLLFIIYLAKPSMLSGFDSMRDDRQFGAFGDSSFPPDNGMWRTPSGAVLDYNVYSDVSAISRPNAAYMTAGQIALPYQSRSDWFKGSRFMGGADSQGRQLPDLVVGPTFYRADPRDITGQTTSVFGHVPTNTENEMARTAYGH